MMVPTEHADGQAKGGAALAQHGDHLGDAVQGQEVDEVLQDDHQLLLTPPQPQTTPPRTSSSPPGGHTPVRVLCTPLWKRKRDKRMSSSSSKPRRSSQGVKPRTRRTGQQTPPTTSLRPEEPQEPESARPGSNSPQINAKSIISTQPTNPEEKATTEFNPTGDKQAEMSQQD